jgi:hypothetical protein
MVISVNTLLTSTGATSGARGILGKHCERVICRTSNSEHETKCVPQEFVRDDFTDRR